MSSDFQLPSYAKRRGVALSRLERLRNRNKNHKPLPLRHDEPPSRARVPFLKAKAHHCRWAYGSADDGSLKFCGQRVVPGYSWCPHHFRRVFVNGREMLAAYEKALSST